MRVLLDSSDKIKDGTIILADDGLNINAWSLLILELTTPEK